MQVRGHEFDESSLMQDSIEERSGSDTFIENEPLLKPFATHSNGVAANGVSDPSMGVLDSVEAVKPAEALFTNNGYDRNSNTFIEIATYAGVDVFECYSKEKPPCLVMRRCNDNWLNITQVFKAGSFTKAQRTKILEKESNEIKHEKIQGGYGRFQGTWIPWESTKYLVEKYNIQNVVVKRIVEFEPDANNLPPRRSKVAQIKKLDPTARITSPSSYKKTPRKDTKTPMKKRIPAKRSTKKERGFNPSPLQNIMFQTPQHQLHQQQTSNQSTEKLSTLTSESETPIAPVTKAHTSMLAQNQHTVKYHTTQKPLQFFPYPQNHQYQHHVSSVPTVVNEMHSASSKSKSKEFQITKQMVRANPAATNALSASAGSMLSNGTSNGSSIEVFSANGNHSSNSSESPLPASALGKGELTVDDYKELILDVLSSEYESAEPTLPDALYRPPGNMDINFLIDDQGHTPLHWAVAMSNIPLIRVLLVQDADMIYNNDKGFNCLTKALFYNNCYKAGSFPQIISMLKSCLITPDANGRLPLHYLVELTVNKSKEPHVIEYYLETIIDGLGKEDPNLMRMSINFQDSMGNTPLHLAALNKNMELCQKLVYLGASPDILNGDHQTASMILSRFRVENIAKPPPPTQLLQSPPKTTFLSNTPKNSQEDKIDQEKVRLDLQETTNDSIIASTRKGHSSDRPEMFSLDKLKGSLTPAIKINPPSPPTLLKLRRTLNHSRVEKPVSERVKDSVTSKSASKLSNLTHSLTNAIDERLGQLQYGIQLKEDQISEIDAQLSSLNAREKKIGNSLEDFTFDDLAKKLKSKNIQLDNYMERSQALSLATLVQDEENNLSKDTELLAQELDLDETTKLLIELCFKQYKRRYLIKQIKESRDELISNDKISKFRRLIGMSIENIDTKLDDIEKDLQCMEEVQT